MNCDLENIGQDGTRYVHRCRACGAQVLSRYSNPALRRRLCGKPAPPGGPGTELRLIFAELGIKPKAGCGCKAMAAELDRLGVAGCQAQRAEIVARLREKAGLWGLSEKAAAAFAAVWQGKPLSIEGLVDLAIRRAAGQSEVSL